MYGVEVSPDLISRVTGAVADDVIAWQNRPLDPVYCIVYFDALIVKVRDQGVVRNKAVYLALGVTTVSTGRQTASNSHLANPFLPASGYRTMPSKG